MSAKKAAVTISRKNLVKIAEEMNTQMQLDPQIDTTLEIEELTERIKAESDEIDLSIDEYSPEVEKLLKKMELWPLGDETPKILKTDEEEEEAKPAKKSSKKAPAKKADPVEEEPEEEEAEEAPAKAKKAPAKKAPAKKTSKKVEEPEEEEEEAEEEAKPAKAKKAPAKKAAGDKPLSIKESILVALKAAGKDGLTMDQIKEADWNPRSLQMYGYTGQYVKDGLVTKVNNTYFIAKK